MHELLMRLASSLFLFIIETLTGTFIPKSPWKNKKGKFALVKIGRLDAP